MNKPAIIGIIGLILVIISASSMVAPAFQPVVKADNAVPLDTVKHSVQQAYNYLLGLERTEGSYSVISEYPDIPITVYSQSKGWWWIPGIKYYITQSSTGETYLHVEIRDSTTSSNSYGTSYTWYMDLKLYSVDYVEGDSTDVTYATLKVTEWRGYPYSYVKIDVTYSIIDSYNAVIYLAGSYVGELKSGNQFYVEISDNPTPSMRTAVRHVDVIGALALANLAGYSSQQSLWNFAKTMMNTVFQTDKPLYDIYNSMFQGFTYTGQIDKPNGWQFYDAQWFSYGLGYYKIWDFMNNEGWIWRSYPIYPYKSKIVAYAERTHTNGGDAFLTFENVLSDPLY